MINNVTASSFGSNCLTNIGDTHRNTMKPYLRLCVEWRLANTTRPKRVFLYCHLWNSPYYIKSFTYDEFIYTSYTFLVNLNVRIAHECAYVLEQHVTLYYQNKVYYPVLRTIHACFFYKQGGFKQCHTIIRRIL